MNMALIELNLEDTECDFYQDLSRRYAVVDLCVSPYMENKPRDVMSRYEYAGSLNTFPDQISGVCTTSRHCSHNGHA